MHNLGTVIGFEVPRTLRKPSFWIVSLLVPVMMALVFGLVFLSSASTEKSADEQGKSRFDFAYTDASGMIDAVVAQGFGGHAVADRDAAVDQVRSGALTAFFAFPSDLTASPTEVYGQDVGLFDSGRYSAVAQALVSASVAERIGDPQLAHLASSGVTVSSTTFRDGEVSAGVMEIIAPALFVVLFYMSVLLLGNQMLNVTLEEKENRVTEMILTTIRPTTLIVGKVVGLLIIGLVQGLIFSLPVIAAARVLPQVVSLPSFDLSQIVIDPGRVAVGAALFVAGFLMLTGLLVALGSVMPTAKDAGSAYGAIVISLFLPLYAASTMVTEPDGLVARIFTYFPLTGPVAALIRNAVGGLPWWEAIIVMVELFACAALFLTVGVRLFRTGSISYDRKLSIRNALRLRS